MLLQIIWKDRGDILKQYTVDSIDDLCTLIKNIIADEKQLYGTEGTRMLNGISFHLFREKIIKKKSALLLIPFIMQLLRFQVMN